VIRLFESLSAGIVITRRAPERTLVWEGQSARGTIELAPSGWGTRVSLTATVHGTSAAQTAAKALDDVLDEVGAARRRPFSRG
jgi:hypothetical protein